ncbi:MAG: IS200/IS605 family transposase [Anaerolineales bacterium]|nr:IS200/IS605 family transposase [Anaerolineales bacterium]
MAIPLLVFTRDVAFGELIARSLEDAGRFSVRVLSQVGEGVGYIRKEKCPLTFLDLDLPDAFEAGYALLNANSEMCFIFLSGDGPDAALSELNLQAHLTKPFYLPDLLEMMDKMLSTLQDGKPQSKPTITPAATTNGGVRIAATTSGDATNVATAAESIEMPWLANVNRAAQHLTRLTLESSAQAALINRNNELWAYAGQLPQSAAHELAQMVARYWDQTEESDLVRFVRLGSTNAEHMLYATRLAAGLVLALTFDAETPFSTIRTQAGQLVRSLAVSQPSVRDAGDNNGVALDVPPPAPAQDYRLGSPASIPPETGQETSIPIAIQPVVYSEPAQAMAVEPVMKQTTATQADIQEKPAQEEKSSPDVQRLLDTQGETRPHVPAEESRRIVLEPVSPSVYNLTYVCLLIPRFAQHHLTGDLADRLAEWMPQMCVAYGWRLEYISVRPDYLQWLINGPPVASPSYIMRIIRSQISEKIFEEFPRFKKENPSGDFWAPGHLIIGGTQPAPAQMIKDFIQQTRRRQGVASAAQEL